MKLRNILLGAALALSASAAFAFQYGTAVVTARLDAIESAIGTAPTLNIYTGSVPANCATAASGTLIATGTLPSDWMAAASSGSKAKLGTWTVTGQAAAGGGSNAGYFRLVGATPATQCIQGTITVTGGGGDMTLDNISIANGQTVTVNTFTITSGNQ